ncbi:MAG: bifunctional nuclease family protein [Coriobacteriales bacterium]|nr:bifunctional nuclease family protein [Coriobacteriales bacterium]
MIPVSIETLVVGIPPSPSVIVLRPTGSARQDDRALPIWIGPSEATAIGSVLEKQAVVRPMTHDLLTNAIHALHADIDRILIDRVEGSTFYATVVLNQGGETLRLDARPSDSIALAVRTSAPLFVSEEVLDAAALPFLATLNANNKDDMKEFREFLDSVKPEDFGSLEE